MLIARFILIFFISGLQQFHESRRSEDCYFVYVYFNSIDTKIDSKAGNDYIYNVNIGQQKVMENGSASFKLCDGDEFSIQCKVKEVDPVFEDESVESQLFLKSNFKPGVYNYKKEVVVKEQHGRYSGHASSFMFSFTITVTDKF